MTKRKGTKEETVIYKTLHRKLKIALHEPHWNTGVKNTYQYYFMIEMLQISTNLDNIGKQKLYHDDRFIHDDITCHNLAISVPPSKLGPITILLSKIWSLR